MRDDVRIISVESDDEPERDHGAAVRAVEARLRDVRAELDEVARQRDQQRLLRQSWHDQWRRDAELRHVAERDLAEARAALAHARDLLEAWASCHDDPALERRTERIADEIDEALRPGDVW